jgi:hypothetical protein
MGIEFTGLEAATQDRLQAHVELMAASEASENQKGAS